MRILAGTFILLHGLVHFWYLVLSLKLVAYKPEMGWTGSSWLLSYFFGDEVQRSIASVSYPLAGLLFMAGAIGIYAHTGWAEKILILASILSSLLIVMYFDGRWALLVQKGLIGLAINMAIIAWLLLRSSGS